MREEIKTRMDEQIHAITTQDTLLDIVLSTAEDSLGERFTYQGPVQFCYDTDPDDFANSTKYYLTSAEAFDGNGVITFYIEMPMNESSARRVADLTIRMDGSYNEAYYDIPSKAARRQIFALFSDIEDAVDGFVNPTTDADDE